MLDELKELGFPVNAIVKWPVDEAPEVAQPIAEWPDVEHVSYVPYSRRFEATSQAIAIEDTGEFLWVAD